MITYAEGIDTDRPDTFVCDGYVRSLEWRRDKRGSRQPTSYRAEFDIDGHPSALTWVVKEHQDLDVPGLAVQALLGSTTGWPRIERGDVILTVDGHVVGGGTVPRAGEPDSFRHSDGLTDLAWRGLLLGGSVINAALLAAVAIAAGSASAPIQVVLALVVTTPAVVTFVLGRLVGLRGLMRWLLAYGVILVAGFAADAFALMLVV